MNSESCHRSQSQQREKILRAEMLALKMLGELRALAYSVGRHIDDETLKSRLLYQGGYNLERLFRTWLLDEVSVHLPNSKV